MDAETAYLFRHAMLREGAYQLFLPAQRAGLHGLVLDLCETLLGDDFAPELARHARLAALDDGPRREHLQRRELHWSEVARTQARVRYDSEAEVAFARAIVDSPLAEPLQRCVACYESANTLQRLGRWDETQAGFTRLAELAAGDGLGLYRCHAVYGLAYLAWLRGDAESCDRQMQEWLRLTEQRGDEGEMNRARLAAAIMQFNRGQLARALQAFREGVPLLRQTASPGDLATHLGNYAIVLQECGHMDEAEPIYREALGFAQASGRREIEGSMLGSLGTVMRHRGRHDEATELTRESIRIAEEIGSRRGRCIQLGNLGNALKHAGRVEEAQECFAQAMAEADELGSVTSSASMRTSIGDATLHQGRRAEAVAILREAAGLWKRVKDAAWEAYTRSILARALRLNGEYEAAGSELAEAQRLLADSGSPLDIFVLRSEEAHLALATGVGAAEAVEAVGVLCSQLGEAFANSAGKDWAELQHAAAAGTRLVHGTRPEALPQALLQAIERDSE